MEITDAAIEAAVQLSERYLNDRYLPDKAIDLIDEASAKFHLQTVYAQSDRTQEYEKEREDLYEQKEQALIAGDLERGCQVDTHSGRADGGSGERETQKTGCHFA